jgi:hypothetical protein
LKRAGKIVVPQHEDFLLGQGDGTAQDCRLFP